MTFEGSASGFSSDTQAETIATILERMSESDAYGEKEQSIAKRLATTIHQYIKEGIILDKRATYSTNSEEVLSEAFAIYVEAKRQ